MAPFLTTGTFIKRSALALAIYFISSSCLSSPWIDPGNERIRHHVQYLADSKAIHTPITSWPITWVSLKSELDGIDHTDLSDSQRWSYQYLMHEFEKASNRLSYKKEVHASNDRATVTGFETDSRESLEASLILDFVGDRFAYKAQANFVDDPLPSLIGDPAIEIEERSYNFAGSYIAGLWGNWALGVGAIDRWWGPGWQSSMILSHNARPAPGLFIQRNNATPFKTPLLSWLGPWQMTTFMNQLEQDRGTSNALLWGMRVAFKPLKSLEIGLSRTAQWGGEGRPQDLDTFLDLLAGKDNRGDAGIDSNIDKASNEPGNQLAGIDWRYSINTQKFNSSFYGQFIGEDEANGTPSRGIALLGLDFGTVIFGTHSRLAVEFSNSIMSFYDDEKRYDSAYSHPLYPSGYRHYRRSIGSSFDSDSKSSTLRGEHFLANGHQLSWQISALKLNENNKGQSSFYNGSETNYAKINYQMPMSKKVKLSTGIRYFTDEVNFNGEMIDSSIFVSFISYL